MPAFVLFIREDAVADPQAMAAYRASRSDPARYGMAPLAVYPALDVPEGDAPDGIVLLEFPTLAAAQDWYRSDLYQAASRHRIAAAPYRVLIFEGVAQPGGQRTAAAFTPH